MKDLSMEALRARRERAKAGLPPDPEGCHKDGLSRTPPTSRRKKRRKRSPAPSGPPAFVTPAAARWELRRQERRELIAINDPQLFYDMPVEDRRQLLAWVRENVAARRGKRVRDSYWLKHEAEHRLGFYVSNAELKGAMLEAGHRLVWDNRINIGFCCAAKPGSAWGNELREEAEARREMWQPQPGPEEILRELFQQIASGEGEAA